MSRNHWRYLGLDHKRLYQRNMGIGILSMVILCIVMVAVGEMFSGSDTALFRDYILVESGNVIDVVRSVNNKDHVGDPTSAESLFKGGNIGKLTVIRDAPTIEVSPLRVGNAPFTYPLDIPLGNPAHLSYSIDGADHDLLPEFPGGDFGLPEENWLLPIKPNPALPQPREPAIRRKGKNRSAVIMVGDIMWPGTAKRSDTGYVVVDITIHKDATISYEFVSEEPTGKGFRSVTEQAIVFNYDYKPRVVNGERVESTVRLFITICLGCESSVYLISGESEYQIGMKRE